MFPVAGAVYRRVFVDIRKVAASVPVMPQGALVLDVGGGDGAILNPLLDLQPSLRVIAVDIAPEIGQFIRPDLRDRVDLQPATSVRDYIDAGGEAPSAVLISDVFHHVPPPQRNQLVTDLFDVFGDRPPCIVVKDIVPQGARSWLAFWADRNISGDRQVSAISPAELVSLFASVRTDVRVESRALVAFDYPNYCLVITQ
jgi:2-polyprenyl-3-methyl-5-hydroxy-6-metoxy-1,4-benzoquinol methylase